MLLHQKSYSLQDVQANENQEHPSKRMTQQEISAAASIMHTPATLMQSSNPNPIRLAI
jgi:hypothetical protein